MFKDDRMIAILTGILLMVLVGTVIQRADGVSGLFGSEEPVAPAVPVTALTHDSVTVPAQALARIDVLANDMGLASQDKATLAITQPPSCGRVFVQAGSLQYLSEPACAGVQSLTYAVTTGGIELQATVEINVLGVNGMPVTRQEQQEIATSQTEPAQVGGSAVQSDQKGVQQEQANTPVEEEVADASQPEPAQAADEPEPSQVEPQEQQRREPRIIYSKAPVTAQEPAEQGQPSLLDTLSLGGADQASAAQPNQTQPVSGELAVAPATPAEGLTTHIPGHPDPVHVAELPGLPVTIPESQQSLAPEPNSAPPTHSTESLLAMMTQPDVAAAPVNDTSEFLIAIVELREPVSTPPETLAMLEAGVGFDDRLASRTFADMGRDLDVGARSGAELLSSVQEPSAALEALPVDRNQANFVPRVHETEPLAKPSVVNGEATPSQSSQESGLEVARLDPGLTGAQPQAPEAPLSAPIPVIKQDFPPPDSEATETRPVIKEACTVPTSTSLDVRRAGQTIVGIVAPCHAGTVAELSYSGLRFAVTLDGKGEGQILALGFEPNSPALIKFENDEVVDFDLPFKGMDRVSRVALVWDMPVTLELNALEFGAPVGTEGHVGPQNPRSFTDVRRSGGGYLKSYRAAFGRGLNVEVYTHYARRGGESGIVKMMIDFASRNRDRLEGTCGGGTYATPQFMVVRSERGKLDRPVVRRLAALDCSRVAEEIGDKRLISSAVADLIISRN